MYVYVQTSNKKAKFLSVWLSFASNTCVNYLNSKSFLAFWDTVILATYDIHILTYKYSRKHVYISCINMYLKSMQNYLSFFFKENKKEDIEMLKKSKSNAKNRNTLERIISKPFLLSFILVLRFSSVHHWIFQVQWG